MDDRLLKTIDLCAGIGGIRRGFELTGRCVNVASAEIDEAACLTYEHLFHEDPRNDVTSEAFKRRLCSLHYDILLAGFPCQAFSSVGLKKGFEDATKGTIFFDIAKIAEMTMPKVIFLENVQNLVSHKNGETFSTIIEVLEKILNYHVIGVTAAANGGLMYQPSSFIRNSKDFGVPQNRPRVYIAAFSRAYFGALTEDLPAGLPHSSDRIVFASLQDVLDVEVPAKYFMSSGYLETLERHLDRQRKRGYGFGYKVVNDPSIEHPVANTLLATGGSGRERNLIIDARNGTKYAGKTVKGKYSPINDKCIRMMTPREWGRLQGFIGYAFRDEQGNDTFSFPDNVPDVQRYKQFGNSVTIPVIETMGSFIVRHIDHMYAKMDSVQKRLFSMYGTEFRVCKLIADRLGNTLREKSMQKYFDLVYHFGCDRDIRVGDIAEYLQCTSARASQIAGQMVSCGCMKKQARGNYSFGLNEE